MVIKTARVMVRKGDQVDSTRSVQINEFSERNCPTMNLQRSESLLRKS
jgi:hypothetical protein